MRAAAPRRSTVAAVDLQGTNSHYWPDGSGNSERLWKTEEHGYETAEDTHFVSASE